MSAPRATSAVDYAARSMDDATLAHRVEMILGNRRALDKALADAILAEAARRLRWGRKADTDAGLCVTTLGGRAL